MTFQRLLFLVLGTSLFAALLSSCGYRLEGSNPSLPIGAKTIAIAPIQNETFQADLEAQVAKYLRQRLRNNSSVRLLTEENSDLLLHIHLESFVSRQTSISPGGLAVELQQVLSGTVTLSSSSDPKPLWTEKDLEATAALLYEEGEETTGVTSTTKGRGIDAIAQAFAQKVYERIFFNF